MVLQSSNSKAADRFKTCDAIAWNGLEVAADSRSGREIYARGGLGGA
jgi:hypothetical protein